MNQHQSVQPGCSARLTDL